MEIYTDGACIPNPGKGGWAFVILDKELLPLVTKYGMELETTNNRMEMRGILEGIKWLLNNLETLADSSVTIYSDSQYCIKLLNGEYSAKKNLDLYKEGLSLIAKLFTKEITINLEWVRGHSGNVGNEFADFYANSAIGEVSCPYKKAKKSYRRKTSKPKNDIRHQRSRNYLPD